jgi:hypothetical protein
MSLVELGPKVPCSVECSSVMPNVGIELVHHHLVGVDEFVDDLNEGGDGGSTRLVDLLKDLAILDAFLVALDDLVISDANACVAILEEFFGVVTEPLLGLHDDPPEVEGISREIVGHLEVGGEGLG